MGGLCQGAWKSECAWAQVGRGLFERLNVFMSMSLIGQLSTACLVLANLQSIAKPTSETGEAKKKYACTHSKWG